LAHGLNSQLCLACQATNELRRYGFDKQVPLADALQLAKNMRLTWRTEIMKLLRILDKSVILCHIKPFCLQIHL